MSYSMLEHNDNNNNTTTTNNNNNAIFTSSPINFKICSKTSFGTLCCNIAKSLIGSSMIFTAR